MLFDGLLELGLVLLLDLLLLLIQLLLVVGLQSVFQCLLLGNLLLRKFLLVGFLFLFENGLFFLSDFFSQLLLQGFLLILKLILMFFRQFMLFVGNVLFIFLL
jgi:hypothetical protein